MDENPYYTLGQLSSQMPNKSTNISILSELHEVVLQSDSTWKKEDPQRDLYKDPKSTHDNGYIKNNIAQNFIQKRNPQWEWWTSNDVTDLKRQLSMDANSKEYMNQEMVPGHVHNLIQREKCDTNFHQQVDHCLASSFLPTYMGMPSSGMSPGFWGSNSQYPLVDCFMAANTQYNTPTTKNLNESSYFGGSSVGSCIGSSCNGYNEGVVACDGNIIFSTASINQVAGEAVLSPDEISSATVCSNRDGRPTGSNLQHISESSSEKFIQPPHYDEGEFNLIKYGGFLESNQNVYNVDVPSSMGGNAELSSSNMRIPQQNPQRIPETSDILPRLIFNTSMPTREGLLESELQVLQQFQKQLHVPSVQLDEPSEVQSNLYSFEEEFVNQVPHKASKLAQLPPEQSHKVQSVASESSAVFLRGPTGAVKLANYSGLSWHRSGTGEAKNDFSRAIYDIDSDGTRSYAIEDLNRSKRLKMGNFFSFHNGVSQAVAPSIIQHCASEQLPDLVQWSEAPVLHDVEALEVNKGMLSPIKDCTSISVRRNDVIDNARRLDVNNATFISGEVINARKQGGRECTRIGEIRIDDADNSQGLNSDSGPLHSEGSSIGHQEEEIQVRPKSEQVKSEVQGILVAPAADYELVTESEESKILGVSLAEFFTAEQLKEHISSFSQSIDQSGMKEVKDRMASSVRENICQLCGTDKLLFAPEPLYCSSCGVRIKRNMIYYTAMDETGTQHWCCASCFRVCRGSNISFHGVSISKAKLQKERNSEENEEPWVQCDKCKLWQHQICGLFNAERDLEGTAEYICPCCCLEEIENEKRVPLLKAATFGAKDLPSTMLSDHIEKRLYRRLKQEREERARVSGKKVDEVPEAADLVVRVVLSVEKQIKVKQQFLDMFHGESYPAEFPFKSKVILLFQKIEGVDVCILGMYVQEYGSECDYPNRRCVYISYLDSVKYFKPEIETVTGEALRTFVYHEILIAYLDYCKKRGFATCYIWACPPIKGEDYILYCHPETQKTPKSDKLRLWYKSMLRKATKDNVVVDYTNFYDHFFIPTGDLNTKITAARLPYFDGGYWSGAAEDMIGDMEQESGGGLQGKVKRQLTKRTLQSMGHNDSSDDPAKDILVMQKLGQIILPVKENFIIVHLQYTCAHCHEVILSGSRWFCNHCKDFQLCARCIDAEQNLCGRKVHTTNGGEKHHLSQVVENGVPFDTEDKDINLDNGILENRHTLLSFCERNHFQFDTLRRAKHSSMMILYHLHKLTAVTTGTTCSICYKDVLLNHGWHCEICPEFEVCAACYQRKGGSCHNHNLTQRSSIAKRRAINKQAQQQKALWVQEALDVLMHASKCHTTRSNPCLNDKCRQIRKIFHHAKQCKLRASGGCKVCHRTWLLLHWHSRSCRDSDCRVPRCMDIKKRAEILALQSKTQ
ncbi:unnamed protein product [Ilex paraguariensis]|uniref:histone acetyltransferase n=1 Tax=Ilex paraguariensis TaxID=185542 RepID=A0ABC8QVV4_9AQUA